MKYSLMLALVLFGAGVCFGQQWFPENGPWSGRIINSVWILQKGQVVVAGGYEFNDSIEDFGRTNNSGLTWVSFRDTISSWIKSVAFSDSVIGYATGYNGKLIRTYDGALNWVYASSPVIRDFNKIIYVTPSLMFVAGGREQDDSTQTILKSTNGGNSWTVVYDRPGPWLKSIFFIDTLKGFATGEAGTILSTVDGGNTWTPRAAPVNRNLNSVYFINANKGFVVGGIDTLTGGISTVLQTVNGGLTWTVVMDVPGGQLFDISFAGALYGIIVGDNATVLRTTNGGQTWLSQTIPSAVTSEMFNTVKVYDSTYAVIGSDHSRIFVYTTGAGPQAITLMPSQVDTVSATLAGDINTNGAAGTYWFAYSTDSLLLHYSRTPQQLVSTDSPTIFMASVNGLIPDTTYYYYVTVSNIAGTVRGNIVHFYTGPPFITFFQTLMAHNISPQTAMLYGLVNTNNLSANVFFQYGIEQAFDHEVQANPAQLSGDTPTVVSATLSGLQPGQHYYYRLKATDSLGTYYTEPGSFFAVHNEIPNWNFESWQSAQEIFPRDWWTFGNVAEAPSYNGTTALSLFGNSTTPFGASFTGVRANGVEFGGTPFSARPDSLIFYANYDVVAGDTARALLVFKKAGVEISDAQFPLTGTTSGNFNRVSFPISYTSNAIPDTALIGFVSTNALQNRPVAGSWLMVDDVSFAGTTQNVPYPNFDQWDTSTYLYPKGWTTTYSEFPKNFNTAFNVIRTSDAYLGAYAVDLQDARLATDNVFATRATLTTDVNPDGNIYPSFGVSKRYQVFDGYIKYTPENNDTTQISVYLFRKDTLVGSGSLTLDSAVSSFSPFIVNISYQDSLAVPDSATIKISCQFGTIAGATSLIIDNLGFDGYYEGDTIFTEAAIVASAGKVVSLSIYPNPNNGSFEVDYMSPLDEEITLTVYDLNARPVFTENSASSPSNKIGFKLNMVNLPQSVYFVRVKSKSAEITSRFVVAR